MGNLLFSVPSDEILRQAVFDPASVIQKAWVVCFNYTMVAYTSASDEPDQTEYTDKFRTNTRLALNDARIFLEPSEANVQTLMLLGLHGEDFASPNLSWMLVGHASRQMQALGLHLGEQVFGEIGSRKTCNEGCVFSGASSSLINLVLSRSADHAFFLRFSL